MLGAMEEIGAEGKSHKGAVQWEGKKMSGQDGSNGLRKTHGLHKYPR